MHRRTYCIGRGDAWLIEQRPSRGRWAGMWQFITVDANEDGPLHLGLEDVVALGKVSHALTHRRYEFSVYLARARDEKPLTDNRSRKWVTLEKLLEYPLPRPHLKIVEMLGPQLRHIVHP